MSALSDALLTPDDRNVRELVREIAMAEIAPRAKDLDSSGEFPHEAMKSLADAGLMGILIPAEYGGSGGTKLQYVMAVEEVARACAATALTFMTQAHAGIPIQAAGTEEQKQRWLPSIADGSRLGAIALTEPEAGSDLAAASLRATEGDDENFSLRGQKIFITNGGLAQLITVIARTDVGSEERPRHRAHSAFLVAGRPSGLMSGEPMKKMGVRGSNTVELFFDDVAVHKSMRLGEEGDGFRIAMHTLDLARMSTAAQALGIASRALDEAVRYARERQQFGRPIASFQAIQFKLADMHASVSSARQLLYSVALAADATGQAKRPDAALAKVVCSDVAMAVTTEAVQVHGGYGYIQEYEVERLMRDAKITQIYDGTNEINRIVVARGLLDGDR